MNSFVVHRIYRYTIRFSPDCPVINKELIWLGIRHPRKKERKMNLPIRARHFTGHITGEDFRATGLPGTEQDITKKQMLGLFGWTVANQ